MYIKREDAIKAIVERFMMNRSYAERMLEDIPSVETQGENATRCYEFLKTKLGESIVDSKKEFESWYERMVWHVKECDKLARELKQEKWIPCSERLPSKGGVIVQYNDGDFDLLEFPTAYRRADIAAWMPLPMPYKEGADDDAD